MFVPFCFLFLDIIRFAFFCFSGLPALNDIYSIKVLHTNTKKTKRGFYETWDSWNKKIRKSSESIIFNELYFYKRLNHVIVTLKHIISFLAISLQLLQWIDEF